MAKGVFSSLLVSLLTLGATRASAVIPPDQGKVVVTYWRHHYEPEKKAMDQLIARFERENPSIDIQFQTFPYDVYKTKVVATLASGNGPDIVNIHNSWVYGYAKAGLIETVPAEVLSPADAREKFFPLLSSFEYDKRLFGLPIGAGNLALFYNRKHFLKAGLDPSRPPRTWSELEAYARKLTIRDKHGRILQAGASLGLPVGSLWNYFVEGVLRQAGADIIRDDLKAVAWNSPAGVRALEWYTGFIERIGANSLLFPGPDDAFRLELSSMMVEGPWMISHFQNIAPNLEFEIAPLPASDKGLKATYGTAWGNSVTRRASPAARAAAWKFLAFVTRYENMKLWTEATGELPVRREVLSDAPFVAKIGRLQPFLEQMPYSYFSVKKNENEYQLHVQEAIYEILFNKRKPAWALNQAAGRINTMLTGN